MILKSLIAYWLVAGIILILALCGLAGYFYMIPMQPWAYSFLMKLPAAVKSNFVSAYLICVVMNSLLILLFAAIVRFAYIRKFLKAPCIKNVMIVWLVMVICAVLFGLLTELPSSYLLFSVPFLYLWSILLCSLITKKEHVNGSYS